MKWMLAATALVAVVTPVPEPSTSLLTIVLTGALTGIGSVLFSWWRFRKLGVAEREDIESSAAEKAVNALDKALERYVHDLERAQDAIARLERQLADANDRIVRLEEQLKHVSTDRDGLQGRLDAALQERARLELELEQMRREVEKLRRHVGSRRTDNPDEGDSYVD